MASYQHSSSPVFEALLQPALDSFSKSVSQYDCSQLMDESFLEAGVQRCLSACQTGRDFIQSHSDRCRKTGSVDLHFKAIKSKRRLANITSVNAGLAQLLQDQTKDPFEANSELNGFAIYAGDGHYHSPAAHDPTQVDSSGNQRREAVGHFFLVNLRSHFLSHLTGADQSGKRKREHDMRAIKRVTIDELRGGERKGTKVILAWDKAGIDFAFWHKAKMSSGLYFISREKSNMKLTCSGERPFDKTDDRNAGVVSDENVGPGGSGGAMFRRITYKDAVEGKTYVYLTTEMTLPPGLLVLIYKQRWDIEKVFDELKTKLKEKKSWASSSTAKAMQAQFLCLTHNLMLLMEERLLREEGIENLSEHDRKKKRAEQAKENGATYVATALQRFTVRSLKFIRWLRSFVYSEANWNEAVARLRQVYVDF